MTLWRIVARRLQRRLPPAHRDSTIGDLAEDYRRRRTTRGRLAANWWLLREAHSLVSAYRTATTDRRASAIATRVMLASDFRHALRRLQARPAPALVSAALLAVGVGLSTTMFSVVDALLLRPAPFENADRLVSQGQWRPLTTAVLSAWSETNLFEDVEAAAITPLQDEPVTHAVSGAWVTVGMLDMLGVRPIYGRTFLPSDAASGTSDAILISETLWRSSFGRDPAVLGSRVKIGGSSGVIVGVVPGTFRFPAPTTAAWRVMTPASPPASAMAPRLYARLKPGVPVLTAEARVGAIARELDRLPRSYAPDSNPPLTSLDTSAVAQTTRRGLWLLFGGVGLVFVVLCTNVSSLALAGFSTRRRELGVCSALGAGRGRLMREAAIEHGLVGVAGAVAGLVLAHNLTGAIPQLFVGKTLNPIDIDVRALLAASMLGLGATVISGMVPVWFGTRADALESIRATRQVGTETRTVRTASRALIVAQIALACSLLIGSTLLVRSFVNLVYADRGLDFAGITHVRVTGLRTAFSSVEANGLGVRSIGESVGAWPETASFAMSQEIPPVSGGGGGTVTMGTLAIDSDGYRVSPTFFDVYRIPILRGRTFSADDAEGDVVIGERLAKLLWPGEDPLGRTFRIGNTPLRRVIGLAGEITLPTTEATVDLPEFYEPIHRDVGTINISLRCRGSCPDPATIDERIRAIHTALIAKLHMPENDYLVELRLPRAVAEVAAVFAAVAVLTVACGLFSVLTAAVGRRRREFGIRTALGASPGDMFRIVIRDGFALIGAGVVGGLLGGWLTARALASFQYGVSAVDPVTWTTVVTILAVTALVSAWRPALQAMRVDPVKLLKEE